MIPAKCKEARAQICQGFRSLQADEKIYPTIALVLGVLEVGQYKAMLVSPVREATLCQNR